MISTGSQKTHRPPADYLKVLADTEDVGTKIIILGINRAGDNLISFAPDLVNRIDVVRFETEPDEKIEELIRKGESTLNIDCGVVEEVTNAVGGSFYLAQMLCREYTQPRDSFQRRPRKGNLTSALNQCVLRCGIDLAGRSVDGVRTSDAEQSCGPRAAPYLHILNWLANCQTWTLDLRDSKRRHSQLRGSVGQVVDKGFLKNLINSNEDIKQVLHFDENSELLTVEDPQFLFYIRNIPWRRFPGNWVSWPSSLIVAMTLHYHFLEPTATSQRRSLHTCRTMKLRCFTTRMSNMNIRAGCRRVSATDLSDRGRNLLLYFWAEIIRSIWTRVESEAFKERFADGSVIPIWFAGRRIRVRFLTSDGRSVIRPSTAL